MAHELGDAPIEDKYKAQMTAIMATLDDFLNGKERPRKTGLIILMFPYDDHGGRCNYMSNGANREDVIVLLKEQLARFEGAPDQKGHA